MKQPYASGSSVAVSDKLPEWPEELEQPCGLGDVISYYIWAYDAAFARMEALAAFVETNRHAIRAPMTVGERNAMDELLAACARKEAGR